jgi:hypothetical protein
MKKMFPRDFAGSIALNGGTGGITSMCSLGDFAEMFKIDKTFVVKAPESVDPTRTDPNAPWVVSATSDIGSSNKIVARLLLQSDQILKGSALGNGVDRNEILKHMHTCKETIIECSAMADSIIKSIEEQVSIINNGKVSRSDGGRSINPFPHVENLKNKCSSFLVSANRYIRYISELPNMIIGLSDCDSNFEYLSKRLEKEVGINADITQYAKSMVGFTKRIIDLRNYDEHPKKKRTIIENFKLMPNGTIDAPLWYIEGDESNKPASINLSLSVFINNLLELGEATFIITIMHQISKEYPYFIEMIPEQDVDEAIPIKYRLSHDASKIKFV